MVGRTSSATRVTKAKKLLRAVVINEEEKIFVCTFSGLFIIYLEIF